MTAIRGSLSSSISLSSWQNKWCALASGAAGRGPRPGPVSPIASQHQLLSRTPTRQPSLPNVQSRSANRRNYACASAHLSFPGSLQPAGTSSLEGGFQCCNVKLRPWLLPWYPLFLLFTYIKYTHLDFVRHPTVNGPSLVMANDPAQPQVPKEYMLR